MLGEENSFLGNKCFLCVFSANCCLNPSNSEVKLDITSSYLLTWLSWVTELITFFLILVWMFFALFEYTNVLIVSSILYIDGEIVLIITILPLPPKLSFNILVNFEFLHGINLLFEAKALMHTPKASKLLLILLPSFCLILLLLLLFELLLLLLVLFKYEFVFSLPAKSTRINLPIVISFEFLSLLLRLILKTA